MSYPDLINDEIIVLLIVISFVYINNIMVMHNVRWNHTADMMMIKDAQHI